MEQCGRCETFVLCYEIAPRSELCCQPCVSQIIEQNSTFPLDGADSFNATVLEVGDRQRFSSRRTRLLQEVQRDEVCLGKAQEGGSPA